MVSLAEIIKFDHGYPGVEIKVELIVMNEYLSQSETGIKAVCDNYIKVEEQKHDNEDYYEYNYIYTIEDEIPRIIRMPFVITIYSLLENSVTQLLRYGKVKEKIDSDLKDFKANTLLTQYNKYMEQALKYDFQFSNSAVKNITIINKIRNCIAHANGNFEGLSTNKINEIKDIEKMKIGVSTDYTQLDISYQFLEFSMRSVSKVIEDLMLYMENRYGFK